MTDQTTAPYDAGDAAPAVGYRLPTGDEREQLRAENARLRAELERVTHGRDYAVDLYEAADRAHQETRQELAQAIAERNEARAEVDQLRAELEQASTLLDRAWGLIANASSGDWTRETSVWQVAAERWRDCWHDWHRHRAAAVSTRRGDGQDDTSESAQEALQRAPRTTIEYSADGHCWRCWDCGWVSVGYADRRAAAHGAELHECPTEDGADG